MIKLYKRKPDGLHYWEIWQDGAELVTHWGAVGTMGESKNAKLKRGEDVETAMERAAEAVLREGFSELEPEFELAIQFKCDGFGTPADLDKRHQIEQWMNNALGWTGLGHCDGGDIGSGTANIFSYVVDGKLAAAVAVAVLREQKALEGVTVAFHRIDYDDDGEGGSDYEVFWPEGSTEPFQLFEMPEVPPQQDHISVEGKRLLDKSELKEDLVVLHEKFGIGVVTAVIQHSMVGVNFENSGPRLLASDFVKLYAAD